MSEEPNPTTALEVRAPDHALALADNQTWWTERQIAGLNQLGVNGAGNGDLLVFFHMCKRTGLDPFARQIHMVSRNTKDGDRWVTKWTIQTGIDGYRLIADRADRRDHHLREYEDTQWADGDGVWHDVWTKTTAPTAARVVVLRAGRRFPGVALYREFVQTKANGDPNRMWARMPANQLAKCAEALALRKAYPQDLSGIYTDDEMAQADSEPAGDRWRGDTKVTPQDIEAQASRTPAEEAAPGVSDQVEQDDPGDHPAATGPDTSPPPPVAPDENDRAAAWAAEPFDPKSRRGRHMFALFRDVGLGEREDRMQYARDVTADPELKSSSDMTNGQAEQVIAALEADRKDMQTAG